MSEESTPPPRAAARSTSAPARRPAPARPAAWSAATSGSPGCSPSRGSSARIPTWPAATASSPRSRRRGDPGRRLPRLAVGVRAPAAAQPGRRDLRGGARPQRGLAGRRWPAACAAPSAPGRRPRDERRARGAAPTPELNRLIERHRVRRRERRPVAPARRPLQPLRPGLPARVRLDRAVPAPGHRARVRGRASATCAATRPRRAFIRHPNARRHLIMAVGQFVTDAGHPGGRAGAQPAQRGRPTRRRRRSRCGCCRPTARTSTCAGPRRRSPRSKLARGHFDETALPRLESHVVGALRRGESLDGRLDSFDLAVRLPDESWERIHGALRTRRAHAARRPGPRRRRDDPLGPAPPSVVADLAPAIQADTPNHQPQEPDLMLRRLLREALFHSHKPRRHHAALLHRAPRRTPPRPRGTACGWPPTPTTCSPRAPGRC